MSDVDSGFAGFDPDAVPSPDLDFSRKSENAPTNPDVLVDIKEGEDWVRIPITQTELYINKDGPADITRTAKIKFPAEWGEHSISQYINGFQAQNPSPNGDPYDECRVFMRDQHDDEWQIVHYGYVGGVGPANDPGVFKFWCYDPADLMKGIQVSKSFGEPEIEQILNFVIHGEDNNGRPVGIEARSVFENVKTYLAGVQEVKQQKQDNRNLGTEPIEGGDVSFGLGPLQFNGTDLIDDIFDMIAGTEVTRGAIGGQKHFQINRHNMVDLMDWFAGEVGGKWHFEPTPEGPVLFFDNTSAPDSPDVQDSEIARRYFVEHEIISEMTSFNVENIDSVGAVFDEISDAFRDTDSADSFMDKDVFAPVDTLNNQALSDIKPFNTLVLFGESSTFRERYGNYGYAAPENAQDYGEAGAPGAYTESYPYVKVTYPPLLNRAGGYEYSAPPVESDKVYLRQARKEALKQFREHLSEETEGTITLKGEPHILPWDFLITVPVCNDTYAQANAEPITYEVNSVKHTRTAGDRYTTELGVSITFHEAELQVEAEYREA